MDSAGGLYPPLDTPKEVAPDIWVIDGPAVRFYGLPFPTRMTVVRIAGRLWLHSPIRPTEPLLERLDALGTVAWLIAPNAIHYVSVHQWAARYPEAQVFAAEGVAARAARYDVPFPFHAPLGPKAPPDWGDAIEPIPVPGHPFLNEVVFFHRPSRTAILTDLIENFDAARLPWWMRLLARAAGILAPTGRAPIDMRLSFRDRDSAAHAIRHLISLGPERVILAHGDWFAANGTAELTRAFRWLLG